MMSQYCPDASKLHATARCLKADSGHTDTLGIFTHHKAILRALWLRTADKTSGPQATLASLNITMKLATVKKEL